MKLSLQELLETLQNIDENTHPFDIAELLLELREYDEKLYLEELEKIPQELQALVMIELPRHCHEEIVEHFTPDELAGLTNTLDTDDAAELIRNIEEVDEDVAEEVLQSLPNEDRENLETLISYGEYEAGAYMQTELFSAFLDERVGESILRLKELKGKKRA